MGVALWGVIIVTVSILKMRRVDNFIQIRCNDKPGFVVG